MHSQIIYETKKISIACEMSLRRGMYFNLYFSYKGRTILWKHQVYLTVKFSENSHWLQQQFLYPEKVELLQRTSAKLHWSHSREFEVKCKFLCCQHAHFNSKQLEWLQSSFPSYSKAVTVMVKARSLEKTIDRLPDVHSCSTNER